jgi:hypothetical protein
MCESRSCHELEYTQRMGSRIHPRREYRSVKRGVKASPWPALDEIFFLCYSQAESAMKVEVEVKVTRRSKEWRMAAQP